ncbi:hypothetical protein CH304_03660 [Rhodococcus sp. 15-649-1-2]|nr:hypothetical protein [Rhodococcus sp. 15-649-1-2]OZE86001.1 hypothetical protein CH304_03660 [Rhodococcus sp. 15-649-1-2]
MISLVAIGLMVVGALWRRDGKSETGWRSAPLRATGMIAGGVFRVCVIVASIVLAFLFAAVAGALRSNF